MEVQDMNVNEIYNISIGDFTAIDDTISYYKGTLKRTKEALNFWYDALNSEGSEEVYNRLRAKIDNLRAEIDDLRESVDKLIVQLSLALNMCDYKVTKGEIRKRIKSLVSINFSL